MILAASGSATAGLLQMTVYLCLLLALLAGGLYVARNGLRFFQPKNKGERRLNIAESRMLGNRQFLVVAEYEGSKMLLGVCPGRIDYLCPLGGDGEGKFELPPTAPNPQP